MTPLRQRMIPGLVPSLSVRPPYLHCPKGVQVLGDGVGVLRY